MLSKNVRDERENFSREKVSILTLYKKCSHERCWAYKQNKVHPLYHQPNTQKKKVHSRQHSCVIKIHSQPNPNKRGKRRRKTPLHIHKGTPPFHSFLNWHPSKFDTSLTYINHCFKTSLSTLFVLLLLRPKIHIIQNLVRMISVVSLMYTKTVRPSPPLDLWWPEEGPTVIPLSAHLRAYQEAISVFV